MLLQLLHPREFARFRSVDPDAVLARILSALGLPCQIALVVWAFAAYPWNWRPIGLLFFVVVFPLVTGSLGAGIGRSALSTIITGRPILDVVFIAGTVTLWWKFFPL